MSSQITFNEELFTGKSALNYVYALNAYQAQAVVELGLYIVFSSGVDAGVLVLETAHDKDYAGTWAVLATVTFAAASRVHYVSATGVYRALRVRISTAVNAGTVSAYGILTK